MNNYKKALIYIETDDESRSIQNILFKNSFKWIGVGGNSYNHRTTPYILVSYIDDKILRFIDGYHHDSIELARKGIYPESYPKLFNINNLEQYINLVVNKRISPTYKPKGKIVRENKIFEEVADNIHLDTGDVLNYYDDDAYAFLFYGGYPNGQFVIEQGLTHKNMMGNYLYNLKDENYMKVYHSQENDDYLYDRVEESEYKGRIWIDNKVISFWDLCYTKKDIIALKNIIKIIENKLNITINNDWLIEFFDIERQRLFLITLDKYFKGDLDEDDSKKMSTSYYDYLKQQHLNTKTKKTVPYGYGSKNPKYKSLQYRQSLYQESYNDDIINTNNMPYISRELTPIEQKKHFKIGDTVYIRPDSKKYFNDIDDESKNFIGKTAEIKDILSYRHVYSNKIKYNIENTMNGNIIPDNINYRWNDLIVFVANNNIDEEYDYGFFYRCLYKPSLAEPNYNKNKNKIIRESLDNFSKLPYDSICFKIDHDVENENLEEYANYLKKFNVDWKFNSNRSGVREYVFFTKNFENHKELTVFNCDYNYFTSNDYSKNLKISPLFHFLQLQNFLNKYTSPTYVSKNKIIRTLESNTWYPYRFKTEKEFIKEYGHNWINVVGWNDDNQMDYLFGQPYPFNVTKRDEGLPNINYVDDGFYDYWYINWKMLTNNEPIVPSYKSKGKIERTLESDTWYPYRFKTKKEFQEQYGDNWRSVVQYSFPEYMDDLLGKPFPFDKISLPVRYNRCNISIDMITKNDPIVPSYKPKGKIIRENIITEDCDFVNLPNGKRLTFNDSDAIPFMYINNKLLIGQNGSIHYTMVYDYVLSINSKIDEYELYNNSLKGRIWLNSKVISFWEYIKKEDLVKVISDINKNMDINIDDTWLLDYYESNEFDDKIGKNLIPINDYLIGDYKDNTNNEYYQKKKQQHIDTTFKHNVPSGYGSKSSKYKPLEYRQLLYQESNSIANPKIITKFAQNDIIMERISAKKMEIPGDILLFYHLFKSKGHKLYLVGGCVRDYLMGIKPHDFDMVTDAQPNEVTEILKKFRTDIHGAHFGVVRVYTDSEPTGYEIATYRKDISKGRDNKGNDPKVEIGKHITIKDDVKRRDLTINALFYDIETGEIVDIVGGRKDLENKIIRTVGDPFQRFNEDRLRILRTIRFSAVTKSKIDSETSEAIRNDNRLFGISDEDDVSRERIFAEFLKVKEKTRSNNDPSILTRFINLLIDYDIMRQIFPVLVTEKDIEPTKYLTVALAQTLRNNVIDSNFRQTLIDAKIPINYVDIISILIRILKDGVNEDNVYYLYRDIKSKNVRNDILTEWIKVMRINDKKVKALLYYEPTTSGTDVMKDGFKKAEIGEEIRRRESIKFKKLVNDLKN